jgi:hypothetical protein
MPTRWFDTRFGSWVAGDIPHAYDIGNERTLWVTNDSFLAEGAVSGLDGAAFVRNAAFTERDGKVGLIHTPTEAFLPHQGNQFAKWWWFHGGITVGNELHCFVSEMKRTGPLGWAINFIYNDTWIATISTRDGTVTRLRPAPNRSTRPLYGFSVASDINWTYLYGNNAQYGDGTTENFIARVPYGKVDALPEYWTGARWSKNSVDARSIHTGASYANRLYVFRHGRRWLATYKNDEFWGTEINILEAVGPTGPWTVIKRHPTPTASGDNRTCTYDCHARPLTDGRLHLWWSNNAFTEADVRKNPALYRPSTTVIDI